MLLFAIPDESERKNHFEIAIPNGASFILTHELDGEIKGLNEFKDEHPPVAAVFFSFRIMVSLGMLMLATSWLASTYLVRKKHLPPKLLTLCTWMTFSGWIATLAGWYVTEVGRQPYLVSGVLTTEQAVTQIPSGNVALSLLLYALVYSGLLIAYVKTLFLMARRAVEIEEYQTEEHPKYPNTSRHEAIIEGGAA